MAQDSRNRVLVDRGLMTKTDATAFYEQHSAYYEAHRHPDGSRMDKSEMAPYFGKEPLNFNSRKCSYFAFRHDSIADLISAISTRRPEITMWPNYTKHELIISQPHNGTYFAIGWCTNPLGNYSSPILKLLSGYAEVLSIYSTSAGDPCSFQRWQNGKCIRAIEWIPHSNLSGKVVDFGTANFNDPIYENKPTFMDINRAIESSGHAGHLIPPRKSKDEEVLAWKIHLPDILK
jgi:hypothetical protein